MLHNTTIAQELLIVEVLIPDLLVIQLPEVQASGILPETPVTEIHQGVLTMVTLQEAQDLLMVGHQVQAQEVVQAMVDQAVLQEVAQV